MRAGFEEAAAGRGRLLLIAGEPGIGKTRLVDEFSSHAVARGARVLWGACQGMGEPAYWPWLQIIRQHVRSCQLPQLVEEMGPGVADIAPLIDELRDHLSDAPVRAADSPDKLEWLTERPLSDAPGNVPSGPLLLAPTTPDLVLGAACRCQGSTSRTPA